MFCTNCGAKTSEGTSFCAGCGAAVHQENTQPTTSVSPQLTQSQERGHGGLGRLIVSGHGHDYVKSAAHGWIIIILMAAGAVALGFFLGNQFGVRPAGGAFGQGVGAWAGVYVPEVRTSLYYWFVWGGIALAATLLGYGAIQDIFAKKTEVWVCEFGVRGAGGGAKFAQSFEDTVTISAFQLEYDRITSVDIAHKNLLSINSFGHVYAIAVANPVEIATVINQKLQQHKSQKS